MLVATPPMGWNSWNTFGEKISEELIRNTADQLTALGLSKAGYQYVIIDDCWSERQRDPVTHKIIADHEKFPHGMRYLADYIHGKGLKFGMYSCAGARTCNFYPGSYDHEYLDAQTFAEYGCDYLKYDFCYFPETQNPQLVYRRMGQALRACGRPILYAMCNFGWNDVGRWARATGANMYRSTDDIMDNFPSFQAIAKSQLGNAATSAPHCFNDMDMLTVGMFGKGNVGTTGCNLVEYRTQFALWCMMGSPLILGCDLSTISKEVLELVTNRELIAIDQDPECRPAYLANVLNAGDLQTPDLIVLVKLLADGDLAIGFFNLMDHPRDNILFFEYLGMPNISGMGLRMKEVFTGQDYGVQRELFSCPLEPHACSVFRATPVRL